MGGRKVINVGDFCSLRLTKIKFSFTKCSNVYFLSFSGSKGLFEKKQATNKHKNSPYCVFF
jgi:hypothetical protein